MPPAIHAGVPVNAADVQFAVVPAPARRTALYCRAGARAPLPVTPLRTAVPATVEAGVVRTFSQA